jgi:hypothetical protein
MQLPFRRANSPHWEAVNEATGRGAPPGQCDSNRCTCSLVPRERRSCTLVADEAVREDRGGNRMGIDIGDKRG